MFNKRLKIIISISTTLLILLIFSSINSFASTLSGTTYLKDKIISSILFVPDKVVKDSPSNYGLKYEDVCIDLDNKNKLYGWYVPAEKKTNKYIIYLHGTKGNIGLYLGGIKELHKVGANILIVDYEGFGKSTGKVTISRTIKDAIAMYDYLIIKKKAKPKDISLFGYSYGGALTAELAKRKEVHAILLESTFTSLLEIGVTKHSSLVKYIVSENVLNTKKNLKEIKVPTIIAFAGNDKIIPPSNSKDLYNVANKPKYLFEIKNAEHHNIFKFVTPEYLTLIKKILI